MVFFFSVFQVVNHPYLIDGVEPEPFVEGEHIYRSSTKLSLLNDVLEVLHERNRRVLIFSQSTRMLDLVT